MLAIQNFPIGPLGIEAEEEALVHVYLPSDPIPLEKSIGSSEFLQEAFQQIKEYLLGKRESPCMPLKLYGSSFQISVWQSLVKVRGCLSYKDLAVRVGVPQGARAVGQACRNNPLPLFIPCHRVIPSRGQIGKYRGGEALKKRLLDLEICGEYFKPEDFD